MKLITGRPRRMVGYQTRCLVVRMQQEPWLVAEGEKKNWVSVRALAEGSTRELKAVFPSPHGAATFLYSIAGLEWCAAT